MIDVIITTYNRCELLQRTMHSFFANTNLENISQIIISNDGSTDGTQAYVDSLALQFPQIKKLPDPNKRMGLIPRFNMAFARCGADIITEFQDDVEFFPHWLEKQLPFINKVDFITGYDAPEHKTFSKQEGYPIKHSTGFLQLTAKREIWKRWFPMKPEQTFPTPCMRDGKSIGSNIDTRIFGRRKNNPKSPVHYMVIPGLIHRAQHYNSTWRPSIDKKQTKLVNLPKGGLSPEKVQQYWQDRHALQKGIAVGFAGRPESEQSKILAQKQALLAKWVNKDAITIDYGSGTGAMTGLFNARQYTGIDLTAEFIEIARSRYYDHEFRQAPKPGQSLKTVLPNHFEQFFTANVLQHNNDFTVAELFRCISEVKKDGFTFVLYENTHPAKSKEHMRFRSVREYVAFAAEHFTIKSSQSACHVVHGEQHSVIKIEV